MGLRALVVPVTQGPGSAPGLISRTLRPPRRRLREDSLDKRGASAGTSKAQIAVASRGAPHRGLDDHGLAAFGADRTGPPDARARDADHRLVAHDTCDVVQPAPPTCASSDRTATMQLCRQTRRRSPSTDRRPLSTPRNSGATQASHPLRAPTTGAGCRASGRTGPGKRKPTLGWTSRRCRTDCRPWPGSGSARTDTGGKKP